MTNGFSSQEIERKPIGFLPHRLGAKIIYCNRHTPKSLWYERIDNDNVDLKTPNGELVLSFVSKVGGLVALKAYAPERHGEIKWKIGLSLRGPFDQVYQFEAGLGSLFSKGLLWGLCAANEQALRTGEIGIMPTHADPTKVKSKNVGKILYCNIFVNGEEMPYYPGGTDRYNWVELLTIALTKCNGYAPDPADLPTNANFGDYEDDGNDNYQTRQPAKTQQPARPTTQPTRSGVTYPNAPLRGQTEPSPEQIAKQAEMMAILERETAEELARQRELVQLDQEYNTFFRSLENWYKSNGLEIDRDRLDKVVARGGVTTFEELSIHRKHQIVATFSIQLLIEKSPGHPAIETLGAIVTPNPYKPEVFNQLVEITKSAFADLVPF